jgi:flagellar hook protein FlgE
MFTSFSTALSALNATSTAIDVVGNNLANLNTTGYKESVVSFHDLVSQSLGAGLGETQVGFGVARPLTTRQFSQGALQASSGQLDAAIEGDGFFVVRDSTTNAQLYTRAGDFQVDKNGNLLTSTGQMVEGWTQANGVMNTSGAVSDIQIPVGQLRQPAATTTFSLSANLNASAVSGVTSGATMDNFSTPIHVIDSLGNPLVLTATFTKDPATPLQWNYQITIPGDATTAGVAGTPTALLATPGVLTFDASGKMVSPAATAGLIPVTVTGLNDNAADLNINFNLFGADGSPTITQFSQPSATSANSQDGVPAAQLIRVGLGDGGQVLAQYSNGTQQVVAQLALASIRNPGSLIAVGQNNYEASEQTAQAAVGVADTGGRGQIKGGSLESSTVDIATEFTNLIVLQRAYQANGKVITAGDQISQDTINLIR